MEESKHLMLEIPKKQNIPLFNNLYSRLLFQIQAETRIKKYSYSSVLEDFVCLSVEVLLFCLKNSQSKETEDFKMKKEYYRYVGGQKVKVSEDIYKVYWREREYEKYLEQVDRKNHLLFFRPWIRMDILQIISLMKVLMSKRLWKHR